MSYTRAATFNGKSGDPNLDSYASIFHVFSKHSFDECYHLAAQSFVAENFADGFSTMDTNINGTHCVLAALRELQPKCRFYFAGSSEMFGSPDQSPQSEVTRFHSRSPYGISKVAGFHLSSNYRETYGMFCATEFSLTTKAPGAVSNLLLARLPLPSLESSWGLAKEVRLGNIEAKRDWGHARDYVRAMHLMMQQPKSDDYVVATGEAHSVLEFCSEAFAHVNLDFRDYVKRDETFYRPPEADLLIGDASKAYRVLQWRPTIAFAELIREMIDSDIELISSSVVKAAGAPFP